MTGECSTRSTNRVQADGNDQATSNHPGAVTVHTLRSILRFGITLTVPAVSAPHVTEAHTKVGFKSTYAHS